MLTKIMFTIGVVVAIWKAFSLISRFSKSAETTPAAPPKDRAARPNEPKAVELQPCPRCGAYVDPRQGCRGCDPQQ